MAFEDRDGEQEKDCMNPIQSRSLCAVRCLNDTVENGCPNVCFGYLIRDALSLCMWL